MSTILMVLVLMLLLGGNGSYGRSPPKCRVPCLVRVGTPSSSLR